MTDPLRFTVDVACSSEHAFVTWTSEIGTWWPPDHTVTGQAERVVLQEGIGGRIYERGPDGVEHEWGEVTVWEPPSRLAYLWHIGRGRAEATEVEIHFLPADLPPPGWRLSTGDGSDWEWSVTRGGARTGVDGKD